MTVREKLFSEVETLCKGAGLDSKMASQELSEFIGEEEVIDYYITQNPLPSYPDTMFDIMMFNNKFLYDYEITQQGSLRHMLPLRTIIEISEEFQELDEEKYLSVNFRVSALGMGLVLQDKLTNVKGFRRFVNVVAKTIAATM